jgi:hypothetical protein
VRIPLTIVPSALLIAASILIVGRYSVGSVVIGAHSYTVFGVDNWTGAPFMRQSPTS